MKWEEWRKEYGRIVADFGYDPVSESTATSMGKSVAMGSRNVLTGTAATKAIRSRVGPRCLVAGGAPRLLRDMRMLVSAGEMEGRRLVATDSSCSVLGGLGILPDLIVTDADGDLEEERQMNANGSLMIIHFHGDNYRDAAAYVMTLEGKVVITTQSGPTELTHNFGGFTDGDRAILLCEEFGAREVTLAGFDFDEVSEVGRNREVKLRKLGAARRIVQAASARGLTIRHALETGQS